MRKEARVPDAQDPSRVAHGQTPVLCVPKPDQKGVSKGHGTGGQLRAPRDIILLHVETHAVDDSLPGK